MTILQALRDGPSTALKITFLFALNIAIWTYAGWAIGNTQGRGWRGAVIEGSGPCRLVCKL